MSPSDGYPTETAPAERRRTHRTRRGVRSTSGLSINLTPMIDVTFLLLVFFLVTSTFAKVEGLFAAKLPRDSGLTVPALPISPLIVRLTPDGDGCRIRIDNFTAAPTSFGDLAEFLISVRGNPGFDDQTPVVIVADDALAWDYVAGCWNAAVRASCKNIAFGAGR